MIAVRWTSSSRTRNGQAATRYRNKGGNSASQIQPVYSATRRIAPYDPHPLALPLRWTLCRNVQYIRNDESAEAVHVTAGSLVDIRKTMMKRDTQIRYDDVEC
ncbi:hypothetical protein Y032_0106g3739 [Ancylostoma ceylanicum]|uniref:Uncharacterized protein n=1 Tax=Ancylostoma ceylanicum TaxID=53326 RepID=A0A016TFT5_9BILA|nr:hypothetical protein Y032_0106g3739 [Ancylostoma ceylanicum]